jgi:DNA-binding SARP family transcriptional activator
MPVGRAAELMLLLVARPDGVTKEQAGVALWPDASAAQVRNAFHVTLHHLRRALGGADRDNARPWVVFADGRYRLVREAGPGAALDCDLDAVLAAAETLRRAERQREALDEDALAALGRALARRLRGEFGEGVGAGDWAVEVQDAARAAWADGTQLLARQHARAGRHAAGAAALETLVARDPLREGAHRELMVLLAAAGERARALRHYDHLAAALRREVNAEPARETRALAEQLRQMA